MAKRNDPVGRARGRKPAPVKKPFPVGFAVGVAVLVLFLGSILAYAVRNTGIGDKSSLKYAESQISGLQSSRDLKKDHKPGVLSYPDSSDSPPVGGDHNVDPQSCQVYTAALANEHAVHSLEHGAVWVTYNPAKATPADITTLKALVDGNPDRLMSPYPGLKSAISLEAWGERVFVDKASDPRVKKFLDLFTKGPQALERTATCVGTTQTGPLSATPTPTTAPTASTAPRASTAPTAATTVPSPAATKK
jgi:hypothetical protein